jgi:hypothetical protein
MKTRTRVALALVAAVAAAGGVTAAVIFSTAPQPGTAARPGAASRPSTAARPSTPAQPQRTTDHVVTASEGGTGRSASMLVTDPYAAGSKLQRVEYHLHDGYTKRVIIPGGAYVAAEDIAICGLVGTHYPDNGFPGTGLPCKPALHTTEVLYHQHTGDLTGRFRPRRPIMVTEVSHGTGRYLTFGHIDHGALMSVEYYWANGEHLTVNLRGDVLVDHIELITSGGRLAAVATRHS